MNPPLPSHQEFVMLESFTVTMIIRYENSIKELRPQVWTNVITKRNATGKWHALDMTLLKTEADGKTHHFRTTCVLTGQGTYEFTTRVGIMLLDEDCGVREKFEEEEGEDKDELEEDDDDIQAWKWGGGFGANGRVVVHPPNNKMPWTTGPQYVQVSPNVYIGNYIAASHAQDLGFSAVLNMSTELEDFYPEEAKILYKKIGMPDGAHNPIPASAILEAVAWINDCVTQDFRVLVHCRAGIGRSGSIGIAYLFSRNPQWSFKDTLKTIWKSKPDIYPHKDLDITLEKIYPREQVETGMDESSAIAPEALVI